jgi:hypothetical protein
MWSKWALEIDLSAAGSIFLPKDYQCLPDTHFHPGLANLLRLAIED